MTVNVLVIMKEKTDIAHVLITERRMFVIAAYIRRFEVLQVLLKTGPDEFVRSIPERKFKCE